MSSALKFSVTGLILAILGSFLALGIVPQDDPAPIAALAVESPTASTEAAAATDPDAQTTTAAADPTPWTPPVVERDPSKSIYWPTASVAFEADDLLIKFRGETFEGGSDPFGRIEARSYAGQVDDRDFELEWLENDTEMRLSIDLESDGADYWIDGVSIAVGNGSEGWRGRMFVTPVGQPIEADLRLEEGRGRKRVVLAIEGLRLTAFHPGSGPGPLTGCRPPDEWSDELRMAVARDRLARDEGLRQDLSEEVMQELLEEEAEYTSIRPPRAKSDDRIVLGELLLDEWDEPDHQFKGTGIWTMEPSAIESLLRRMEVCFEFNYRYPTGVSGEDGSATVERWCTAPPGGEVTSLYFSPNGYLRVDLWDPTVRVAEEVPPQGWNCPTN